MGGTFYGTCPFTHYCGFSFAWGKRAQFGYRWIAAVKTVQPSISAKRAQFGYRWIAARPTAADLTDELMKIVRDVRMLNTKHMNALDRGKLISETEK